MSSAHISLCIDSIFSLCTGGDASKMFHLDLCISFVDESFVSRSPLALSPHLISGSGKGTQDKCEQPPQLEKWPQRLLLGFPESVLKSLITRLFTTSCQKLQKASAWKSNGPSELIVKRYFINQSSMHHLVMWMGRLQLLQVLPPKSLEFHLNKGRSKSIRQPSRGVPWGSHFVVMLLRVRFWLCDMPWQATGADTPGSRSAKGRANIYVIWLRKMWLCWRQQCTFY